MLQKESLSRHKYNLLYFRMSDMPKLRGHHLICLHFFNGKGYNLEFVENLRDTLKKAEGSGAEVSNGADDICQKCPYLKGGKCLSDEHSNDEIMEMDKFALSLLGETSGAEINWHSIKEKIPEVFILWLEEYCKKCPWENACREDSLYRELKYGP